VDCTYHASYDLHTLQIVTKTVRSAYKLVPSCTCSNARSHTHTHTISKQFQDTKPRSLCTSKVAVGQPIARARPLSLRVSHTTRTGVSTCRNIIKHSNSNANVQRGLKQQPFYFSFHSFMLQSFNP